MALRTAKLSCRVRWEVGTRAKFSLRLPSKTPKSTGLVSLQASTPSLAIAYSGANSRTCRCSDTRRRLSNWMSYDLWNSTVLLLSRSLIAIRRTGWSCRSPCWRRTFKTPMPRCFFEGLRTWDRDVGSGWRTGELGPLTCLSRKTCCRWRRPLLLSRRKKGRCSWVPLLL